MPINVKVAQPTVKPTFKPFVHSPDPVSAVDQLILALESAKDSENLKMKLLFQKLPKKLKTRKTRFTAFARKCFSSLKKYITLKF